MASSSQTPEATQVPSASGRLFNNGKTREALPNNILKARLINTIETAIGRPIFLRYRIPVIQSDPRSPNFYRWKFSKNYPAFPQTKGGVTKWSAEERKSCNLALDKGDLTVDNLMPDDYQPRSEDLAAEESTPLEDTEAEADSGSEYEQNLKKGLDVMIAGAKNSRTLITQLEKSLQYALPRVSDAVLQLRDKENKRAWKAERAANASRIQTLEAQLELANSAYNETREQLQISKNSYKETQNELQLVKNAHERSQQELQQELDSLQRRYEQELLAQGERARSHVQDVSQVRANSYRLGFEAGRQQAGQEATESRSSSPQELEAARQEGRESAIRELALGGEDVNNLLQNQQELKSSRKIRELKTIHQNWNDVPQKLLPSYMLPAGHIPGDKTLYLLAKLSKEVSATEASQLLEKEIKQRCAQLQNEPKAHIITNSDIQNVLEAFALSASTSENGDLTSSESSDTPQPQPQPQPATSAAQNLDVEMRPAASSGKTVRFKEPLMEEDPLLPLRKAIMDIINKLPPPDALVSPVVVESFSSIFLKNHVGGSEIVFSKVSPAMQKKQCVSWDEIIRINPFHHDHFSPILGTHGVLTLVDGKAGCGVVSRTYPVILRNDQDSFSYIGHYKLTGRELIPIEIWQACSEERQLEIAHAICESGWGAKLLASRGLFLNGVSQKERLQEILHLFSRKKEPNLRMSWTVLQLVTFNHTDYNILVETSRRSESIPPVKSTPIPPEAYHEAVQRWLSTQEDLSQSRHAIPDSELPSVANAIKRSARNAGMLGKTFVSPSEVSRLKRYLSGLVLELSAQYFLGDLQKASNIIDIFDAFYVLFNDISSGTEEAGNSPGSTKAQGQGNLSRSILHTAKSTSNINPQKRRQSEGADQLKPAAKRPKSTAQPKPSHQAQARDSISSAKDTSIPTEAESEVGVKPDQDANIIEEDIYGVSPPNSPRIRVASGSRKSAAF